MNLFGMARPYLDNACCTNYSLWCFSYYSGSMSLLPLQKVDFMLTENMECQFCCGRMRAHTQGKKFWQLCQPSEPLNPSYHYYDSY